MGTEDSGFDRILAAKVVFGGVLHNFLDPPGRRSRHQGIEVPVVTPQADLSFGPL